MKIVEYLDLTTLEPSRHFFGVASDPSTMHDDIAEMDAWLKANMREAYRRAPLGASSRYIIWVDIMGTNDAMMFKLVWA